MGKPRNWTICPREKWLVVNDLTEYQPVDRGVVDRGNKAEALVAAAHPEWTSQQVTITLPTGRKGRVDMLDEQGGPVEIKGVTDHSFQKMTGIDTLATGYKYQMEYVVQLSGYCVTVNKPGRFVIVNMDNPEHPIKEFVHSLEDAKAVWNVFMCDKIRPNSCQFCNVKQSCLTASKLLDWKPGYEVPVKEVAHALHCNPGWEG